MMKIKQLPKDQKSHWDTVFNQESSFFGDAPSDFAQMVLKILREKNVRSVLELGCGQGRDTILFAQEGLQVTSLDYSETAISATTKKAIKAGLSSSISTLEHNVKKPLPFPDQSFDACLSHMLLCMELSTNDIANILREIHHILKPGGIAVYSVRSNFDKHFRSGTHLGENIYEIGGFVVHFFTNKMITKFSKGYEILGIERMEEGSLPRDLFVVTMEKASPPDNWIIENIEEALEVKDAMSEFQTFLDTAMAPGALDYKTKQLVALSAGLAAGCNP